MSHGVSAELDLLPFARLANLGLPPRVRSLIEGSFHAAAPDIEMALSRALDELDRDLLAHTERGSSPHEQNQCFASLREFRQRRSDFLTACRSSVQRSLLKLADASLTDESLEVITAQAGGVDSGAADKAARDESLALSQIAARAEIRAAAGLQALAFRFGVIAGSAPIEIEALPLGPYTLCAAIRAAARRFDVFPLHRMALYRRIDKCLFAESAALYDAVNNYLAAHRVFAHLDLAPRPAASAEPRSPQSNVAAPELPPTVAADLIASPVAALPPAPARQASQQLPESDSPRFAQVDSVEPEPELALDAQFFRTLRARVSTRRQASSPGEAKGGSGRELVDRRELLIALKTMQAQAPIPVMIGGKWAHRDVAHIKLDLMNQLRNGGDGATRRLSDEDADTIDLMGLLFGQLLGAYRANSISHGVVSRLQIPVLRAALQDPAFFTGRTHPARRLISAILAALADWVEDEDTDRQVVEKLQSIAELLARDYDEDLRAFDRCMDELIRFSGALQKKADIAERRHVEAARGRVKLDLARAAALEVVRQRLAGSRAPAAVVALLDSAWTDAIALSLLRQGVDHPKSSERIELVDHLLAVYADASPPAQRRRALEGLRGSLEEGLAAVGFHDDAVVAAWTDLSGLVDATHEQAQQAAARAMAELIRQKPRLGSDSGASGAAGSAPDDSAASQADDQPGELSLDELAMIERIKQMDVGSWFEFTLNRQGDKARRRLCWFSPVTGRCLFLNVRGAKSEDRLMAQLAREIVRGSVRQVSADRADPVEEAWRAIVASLHGARPQLASGATKP